MSEWISIICVFIVAVLSYLSGKSKGKCEELEKRIDEKLNDLSVADDIISSASSEFDRLHKKDM